MYIEEVISLLEDIHKDAWFDFNKVDVKRTLAEDNHLASRAYKLGYAIEALKTIQSLKKVLS